MGTRMRRVVTRQVDDMEVPPRPRDITIRLGDRGPHLRRPRRGRLSQETEVFSQFVVRVLVQVKGAAPKGIFHKLRALLIVTNLYASTCRVLGAYISRCKSSMAFSRASGDRKSGKAPLWLPGDTDPPGHRSSKFQFIGPPTGELADTWKPHVNTAC